MDALTPNIRARRETLSTLGLLPQVFDKAKVAAFVAEYVTPTERHPSGPMRHVPIVTWVRPRIRT